MGRQRVVLALMERRTEEAMPTKAKEVILEANNLAVLEANKDFPDINLVVLVEASQALLHSELIKVHLASAHLHLVTVARLVLSEPIKAVAHQALASSSSGSSASDGGSFGSASAGSADQGSSASAGSADQGGSSSSFGSNGGDAGSSQSSASVSTSETSSSSRQSNVNVESSNSNSGSSGGGSELILGR
ncbi:hypothetical protein M3Y97_00191100 [Aphelenchoides bicaudatus]|nr:hypothetical protein M3Y97_00191100 [Aphelenchoides bicaudatus]